MDRLEERLPLWLALPLKEKLRMIAHQHNDTEAEVMTMLLMEEVEGKPGA